MSTINIDPSKTISSMELKQIIKESYSSKIEAATISDRNKVDFVLYKTSAGKEKEYINISVKPESDTELVISTKEIFKSIADMVLSSMKEWFNTDNNQYK